MGLHSALGVFCLPGFRGARNISFIMQKGGSLGYCFKRKGDRTGCVSTVSVKNASKQTSWLCATSNHWNSD